MSFWNLRDVGGCRGRPRTERRGLLGDERGAVLLVVAGSLVVMMGLAALAVDVGLFLGARTEAQRVADAAALAGAGHLVLQPKDEAGARAAAVDYALRNSVAGTAAELEPGDVEVNLTDLLVRVTVHRTLERGNPIATVFARALGVETMDLTTRAAARAVPARSAHCLLPTALPDRWANQGSAGWDPAEGDVYLPPEDPGATGYTEENIGDEIIIKPAQNNTSTGFEPGWWYLWLPEGESGTNAVRDWILSCPKIAALTKTGDRLSDKNGNTQSIVKAFEELIEQDPEARWDDGCKCVKGGKGMASPRVRGLPLFDPTTYVKTGSSSNFDVRAFAGLFVDRVTTGPQGQKLVIGRLMALSGYDPLLPDSGPTNPLARVAVLVE